MSFARNAATLGTATLVSRVLGFARDILVAAALGAGPVADAFVVAFRLPLLVRRLFAEGAFNSAFVPLYVQARERGEGRHFAGEVLSALAAAGVGLTVMALVGMPWLVRLTAPGFAEGGGRLDLAVELARVAFPYCLLTLLAVVASAVLNAHGNYVAGAYAPTLVNIVMVAAVLASGVAGEAAARLLVVSILVGGALQLAILAWVLRRSGIGLAVVAPGLSPGVRRFARLVLPGVAAAGIAQVNAFVGLVIASPEPGAVAWLYYADRVYQLPLGIVSTAIGVALLPEVARHVALGDRAAERAAFGRATEFALFLALPAALALGVAARPIARVLFERGAFGPADTAAVAVALAAYAAGLPAFVMARAIQPLFFARTDMRSPLLVMLAGVALDIALSILLFPRLHQLGIALAAAASGWVNAALLAALARRHGLLGLDGMARRRLPRIAVAALVMAGALALALPAIEPWTATAHPLAVRLGALATLCGGGLAVFVAACLALGGLDPKALRAALSRA